jgi:hypothetical protein
MSPERAVEFNAARRFVSEELAASPATLVAHAQSYAEAITLDSPTYHFDVMRVIHYELAMYHLRRTYHVTNLLAHQSATQLHRRAASAWYKVEESREDDVKREARLVWGRYVTTEACQKTTSLIPPST